MPNSNSHNYAGEVVKALKFNHGGNALLRQKN